MISYSGLLKAESSSLIEHAWRHFTGDEERIAFDDLKAANTHPSVVIEFLGVWDTVSGPYRKQELLRKYRFQNLQLDRCVKYGAHIISIDDSRSGYSPIPWEGCRPTQIMEQIWMPGVHADIGGGYPEAFLSTTSLLLMIDKLAQYCPDLSFDDNYVEYTLLKIIETHDVVVNNDRAGFWRFFGRSVARNIESHVLDRHTQHPLVDILRTKAVKIKFKRTTKAYQPSFSVARNGGRLTLATFHPQSWHLKKLENILTSKFP